MPHAEPARRGYIPALGLARLTPIYDPVLRRVMREDRLKSDLVRAAGIGRERLLDVGCGTGTLTILARRASPEAEIVGLDPDQAVLTRARYKANAAGAHITLHRGSAVHLPYPEKSFEVAFASLMLHHLDTDDRLQALREVHRVLRPGGRVLISDFGPPNSLGMRLVTAFMRRLEHTADLFAGRLPESLLRAGFDSVETLDRVATVFGSVVSLRAWTPSIGGA